jgi:hypothetical protein
MAFRNSDFAHYTPNRFRCTHTPWGLTPVEITFSLHNLHIGSRYTGLPPWFESICLQLFHLYNDDVSIAKTRSVSG